MCTRLGSELRSVEVAVRLSATPCAGERRLGWISRKDVLLGLEQADSQYRMSRGRSGKRGVTNSAVPGDRDLKVYGRTFDSADSICVALCDQVVVFVTCAMLFELPTLQSLDRSELSHLQLSNISINQQSVSAQLCAVPQSKTNLVCIPCVLHSRCTAQSQHACEP